MGNRDYDKINKLKEEHRKIILEKDEEINKLKSDLQKEKQNNDELRKKLFDSGNGKGEINRLKDEINSLKRNNEELKNLLKERDSLEMFNEDRKNLIKKIYGLKKNIKSHNDLCLKFINGTKEVVVIARKIRTDAVEDSDFYTHTFRDEIVGLTEKIFHVLLEKKESSAMKYLNKLKSNEYRLPKRYLDSIPNLKNSEVYQNIYYFFELAQQGYHGTSIGERKVYVDNETKEIRKCKKFLNLDNETQLVAIFTLLEFIYNVFDNDESERNLQLICHEWFTTIS